MGQAIKNKEKILVIKLSALGDFIQALGPMRAIRNHHPNAHITLLTTAPFKSFAQDSGVCDEIWLDTRPRWFNPLGWLGFKRKVNQAAFTRVYDLQNNDRTNLYFKLFKPKPEWVGTAKGASHCNTSPDRTAGHALEGHKQTLALAGITDVQIDQLKWLKGDVSDYALEKPYVLLVPGSAPERPEKRWPAKHYATLANTLSAQGYQPVLIGTAAEEDVTTEIAKLCPDALDLTAQTSLAQITTLAQDAAAAIGNDTGPMHLIAATSCPCIAIFSEHSDPVRHAPQGDHVQTIQESNLENLTPEKVFALFNPRAKPSQKRVTKH